MSSQPPQRSRRNASPRAGPQPMRATLPVTLQVRQSSPTRASNGRRSSPALASSPTQPWTTGENHKVKHRRSPDHRASPERSPSSPGFRVEKPKAVRASPIRRTNSLDTIAVPYLSGYWPRSETVNSSSTTCTTSHEPNQKDQSTQTEESDRKGSSHKRSSSWGSADNLKEVRIHRPISTLYTVLGNNHQSASDYMYHNFVRIRRVLSDFFYHKIIAAPCIPVRLV